MMEPLQGDMIYYCNCLAMDEIEYLTFSKLYSPAFVNCPISKYLTCIRTCSSVPFHLVDLNLSSLARPLTCTPDSTGREENQRILALKPAGFVHL